MEYPFTAVDPRYFVDSKEYWIKETGLAREKELYRIGLKRELRNVFAT